jgi:hypothetical protein
LEARLVIWHGDAPNLIRDARFMRGIHVLKAMQEPKTLMAGTSPAMTNGLILSERNLP